MSQNETTMPSSPLTPVTPPLVTKLCHIIKRPDFEGYGFNLHSEKIKPGQYIGTVDAGSPASLAGLKEGDRIIQVNDVDIGNETHKQVVQRIKAISCEVRLLLIDVDGKGQSATSSTSDVVDSGSNNNNVMSETITNNGNTYNSHIEIPIQQRSSEEVSAIAGEIEKGSNGNGVTKQHESSHRDTTESALINNNMMMTISVPPPPSETIAIATVQSSSTPTLLPAAQATATVMSSEINSSSSNATRNTVNNNNKTGGSLQLSMTAAEMRAKLMSKKKYDAKNDSVDLKKKFEIIQKL